MRGPWGGFNSYGSHAAISYQDVGRRGYGQHDSTALVERITDAGGMIASRSDDSVSARVGSRLAFRLFGALMPAGRGRIPMKLDIALNPAGSERTEVTATASSDPGRYLMSTRIGTNAYDMALPQLLDYVQQV